MFVLICLFLLFVNIQCQKTFYELLGVPMTADRNMINSKFRALSLTYHPDKNKAPNADEQWHQLQEAKHALLDKNIRKRYDQHLRSNGGRHNGFKVTPEPPKQHYQDMQPDFGSMFGHGFFDFEDFFTGGSHRQQRGGGGGGRKQNCHTTIFQINGVITRRTVCN